ncbi:riboflavin synthase [Nocardioides sp. HDW12B]|uniref:riboflavin synthase n=1 Tax=Nocardioides sp. HDW12B TaxID=2714939 RepID=UPI00140A4ED8|nr:riboflavin synthase [Nocardioides sp. HDW12B]QIK66590.1 riboflavin synthase [Nocardioides sp. HDW12B]
MFTGIVEELGAVVDLTVQGDAVRLTVRGNAVTEGTALGDSIAVNGCCLTVAELQEDGFTADVMTQTLRLTGLGALRPGSRVNLERAVTPTTRLGGHVVQGHVDATGEVVARTPSEHWELVEVSLPAGLARYVVAQGSITVDGVSLTVAALDDAAGTFTVSLIPETLARTTLGAAAVGTVVNLEVDVMAKYVERLLAHGAAPGTPTTPETTPTSTTTGTTSTPEGQS